MGCKSKSDGFSPAKALYVHAPYCLAKCRYCDFYSKPFEPNEAFTYVRAAGMELAACAGHLARPAGSIFVGGGTPTSLGRHMLARLLDVLAPFLGPETEFTVEVNPGTIDAEMASVLAGYGVNRVSLGAQSFHDRELAVLGRIHTAEEAERAVKTLSRAGLANVGVDLIYGIPGQTADSWAQSLNRSLGLGISHLSCYALSFEPGTPLGEDLAAGRVAEMDEWGQKDLYYAAIEAAGRAGMEHYELSNFARPGRRCRQNLTYWKNEPYLGIGPAAASYLRGFRRTNQADLPGYLDAVLAGRPAPATGECLAGKALMAETLMLGLRMIEGVNRREMVRRFGQDPIDVFPCSLGKYERLGALKITPRTIHIDSSALFVADSILADVISES